MRKADDTITMRQLMALFAVSLLSPAKAGGSIFYITSPPTAGWSCLAAAYFLYGQKVCKEPLRGRDFVIPFP